jgi:hypothetical protein
VAHGVTNQAPPQHPLARANRPEHLERQPDAQGTLLNARARQCRLLRDNNPGVTRASWLVCVTLGVLPLQAAVATAASDMHRQLSPVPVHPIKVSVPSLQNAVALGTLVALDPKSDVAEFRIRCGWYAARGKPADPRATMPKRKLHPGLWKLALRGFAFSIETYPNGPASGIAHVATLNTWERYSARAGWAGTLFLPAGWNKPFLSDGPTTDICRGVLG